MPAAPDPHTDTAPDLTILLTATGRAYLNGARVPVTGHTDPLAAAVRAAAAIAVQLGRPVRATATDPDGTTWPLIIHPDGAVTATRPAATTPAPPHPAEATVPPDSPQHTGPAPATGTPSDPPPSPAEPGGQHSEKLDLAQVPAWPVVTIALTATGQAYVNRVPVPYPPGADPRAAAVRAAAAIAVQLGRPVRATATDPDGTTWPLIIHPDG
ncbi:hypothetical protein TH66_00380, partial [Carbonactinospora thermoautotrophica]